MKPLIIVTVYNRLSETQATLTALKATIDLGKDADLVIVDNHSTDGTKEWLAKHAPVFATTVLLEHNIGCPRALNYALSLYRQPGQPVVKLDNDVMILTAGWATIFEKFAETHPEVAMIGPWYDELRGEDRLRDKVQVRGFQYYVALPLIGHMVYHAGWFMDLVGYFDVLADDHLYGFEDLILCHKAAMLGHPLVVLPAVCIQNLQRKNALDVAGLESRADHIARLRPLYEQRVAMIQQGQYVYTDETGQPKLTRRQG